MTYSSTDFSDDVFAALADAGAILPSEANHEDLDDNASLQAGFALEGINRLQGARRALESLVNCLHRVDAGEIKPRCIKNARKKAEKALAAFKEGV
ncbi:MAG: hypothetical protein LC131_07355 [Anaerolineae bacterium]|nr:hypothetical protein [Rhodocyclaceae bacterium]MCZ2113636.1 hypothetical protein [Anaerolineae bacterium]